MNKLSRIANVVDDFIYNKIPIEEAKSAYNTIIKPAYNKLTYRPSSIDFYNGNQLRGYVDNTGEVSFLRKYPDLDNPFLNESYRSPEEILNSADASYLSDKEKNLLSNYPQPTRELIKLGKSFQDYSNSPDGARLYFNNPISEHREKAYKKWGFESGEVDGQKTPQYLDKRPYADNELINKVYLIGDAYNSSLPETELLLNQRVTNNKLAGSRIANLSTTLPEIDDYINQFTTVPYSLEEKYNNPYLQQPEPMLNPQQQRDAERFTRIRQLSRQ